MKRGRIQDRLSADILMSLCDIQNSESTAVGSTHLDAQPDTALTHGSAPACFRSNGGTRVGSSKRR